MKTLQYFGATGVATLLGFAAVGGQAADQNRDQVSPNDRTIDRRHDSSPTESLESKNLFKARDLIGKDIRDKAGEKLGEIKDLVVNLPEGRMAYAVLTSSDLFGSRDQLAALPPAALSPSADGKSLSLAIDRDKLKGAPSFESSSWPNWSDRTRGREIYSYYGLTPYWESPTYTGTARGGAMDLSRNTTSAVSTERDRAASQAGTSRPGTTTSETPISREALNGMDRFSRASSLLGMNVENPQTQKLGELQDLVLDPHSGRVVYAVLASGGFLGLNEKYFAIPPTAFQASTDERHLVLNVAKDRLKAAPGFDKNNWPSWADQTWAREVYSYYGQEPYWDSNRGTAATSRDALTAGDQGSSEADRALIQQIRRTLNQDGTFSATAPNIRIVTDNGRVTLRGTVASQTEKEQIESRAKQIAGVTSVDNQLEVKR